MAITKLPADVQPAFNEITVEDNSSDTLTVAGITPSPTKSLVYKSVLYDGLARFDVRAFVQSLFYDRKTGVRPWALNDYNLKAFYSINGAYSKMALNAVRQPGEQLNLSADLESMFLTDRINEQTSNSLPIYDGYPVGFALLYKPGYEPSFEDAAMFTIQTTARNQVVRFPFQAARGYIVHGDDTMQQTSNQEGDFKSHTYAAPGTYTVSFLAVTPGSINIPLSGSYANYFTAFQTVLRTVLDPGRNMSQFRLYRCVNLTSVSGSLGLVDDSAIMGSSNNMFSGCSSLSSISANFFVEVNPAKIIDLTRAFANTRLTSIPQGLIQPLSELTNVSGLFYGCVVLDSVPANLFQGQRKINNFSALFRDCTFLSTIPENIFQYGWQDSTGTINLEDLLWNTNISIIPVNLFQPFDKSRNYIMAGLFANCSNVTSYPDGLFNNFTSISNVSGVNNPGGTSVREVHP